MDAELDLSTVSNEFDLVNRLDTVDGLGLVQITHLFPTYLAISVASNC